MRLYYLQKALILGVLLGVVCFLNATFLHGEVRFLFPYSQCNMSELTADTCFASHRILLQKNKTKRLDSNSLY